MPVDGGELPALFSQTARMAVIWTPERMAADGSERHGMAAGGVVRAGIRRGLRPGATAIFFQIANGARISFGGVETRGILKIG